MTFIDLKGETSLPGNQTQILFEMQQLKMITTSIAKRSFLKQTNTALISLLLKKDKDPTVSLINADMKIYAKVLAHRLNKHLGKLINSDQTGFVKGRFSSDNLRRLLHILYFTPDCSDLLTSYGILILDGEKAFDRLGTTSGPY